MMLTLIGFGAILVGVVLISISGPCPAAENPKLLLTILLNKKTKIKGEITMVSIKETQDVQVTLEARSKKGSLAQIEEGSVSFSSSDESIFTVTQNESNGLSATISAVGPGVATLNFSADADLDEGVQTIEGFSAVEILPGDAVGFGVKVGAVTEQAEPVVDTTTTEAPVETTTSTEAVVEETTTQAPVEPPVEG